MPILKNSEDMVLENLKITHQTPEEMEETTKVFDTKNCSVCGKGLLTVRFSPIYCGDCRPKDFKPLKNDDGSRINPFKYPDLTNERL